MAIPFAGGTPQGDSGPSQQAVPSRTTPQALPYPTPKRTRRYALWAVMLFFFGGIAAMAGIAYYLLLVPIDVSASEREFTVVAGSSVEVITDDLQRQGLIRNGVAFALLLRYQDRADKIKAGTFKLSSAMTPRRIADILTAQAPPEADVSVTIPEGFTLLQVSERLAHEGVVEDATDLRNAQAHVFAYDFLPSCAAAVGVATCTVPFVSLEGYLFPDTYRFRKASSPDAIAEKFLENFNKKFSGNLRTEARGTGKALGDIVVMASLVEQEAKADADRSIIAGILWKRIEIGMPLQVDATVLYAKEQKSGKVLEDRSITPGDLALDSPYNTYKTSGLPPDPIANPGLQSLLAALRPEASPYLFYLHAPDGTTVFSRTLEEHNAAKARYLL